MKRKKYTFYLTSEECADINQYALSHGRTFSSFVRYFALAEVKKHVKEKSIYKRLEALEKKVYENQE